jgi:hypothetical protein
MNQDVLHTPIPLIAMIEILNVDQSMLGRSIGMWILRQQMRSKEVSLLRVPLDLRDQPSGHQSRKWQIYIWFLR